MEDKVRAKKKSKLDLSFSIILSLLMPQFILMTSQLRTLRRTMNRRLFGIPCALPGPGATRPSCSPVNHWTWIRTLVPCPVPWGKTSPALRRAVHRCLPHAHVVGMCVSWLCVIIAPLSVLGASSIHSFNSIMIHFLCAKNWSRASGLNDKQDRLGHCVTEYILS